MFWKRVAIPLAVSLLWIGCAAAQPTMFWFNDPVGPDETVVVTGADLDLISSATIARVPDAGTAGQQTAQTPIDLIQVNPLSLKFIVPSEFSPGIYRFTLGYEGGSISAEINVPSIYWVQGDLGEAASPAGWIQVFGRNIVRRPAIAQLLLVRDGAPPVKVAPAAGNAWRGIFRLPDELAPGKYRLTISNGDGGDAERIDAGDMLVRAPEPQPPQSFDVRAYGAIGDGQADSTRAIYAAMEAARLGGGGVVYFPRGRYFVSGALVIPSNVRLRGERTDLVNLVWPDFASPPDALISGVAHFSIEDLTIYASNHHHVISGGFAGRDSVAADASDIAIRRVRIRASAFRGQMDPQAAFLRMEEYRKAFSNYSPDTVRLSGDRIEVSDCDILGSGHSLYLLKASNAVISGNAFSNGRNGLLSIAGSRRVIFEKNLLTGADLEATGGAITTLSKQVSASENIFVGGNTIKAVYGWDREGMTSDGPDGYYFGHAESVTPGAIALSDAPNPYTAGTDWSGAAVMVVNGRGAGEYARVVAFESTPATRSIVLDRVLPVQLDRTSEITVVQAQQNYLIVDNFFEDTGVAAQSYGTALGHVIAGNRSNRTSGFAVFGLSYGHFQPSWHVQILDNQILEGNVYRAGPDRNVISNEAAIIVRGNQTVTEAGRPPLVQGVIVRGNRLEQDAHLDIRGFSASSPGVRDVVVEANTTGPSRVGMLIDRGVTAWLGRRNSEAPRVRK